MRKGLSLLISLKLGTVFLLSLPFTTRFLWAAGKEQNMPGLEANIDYPSPSVPGRRQEAQPILLKETQKDTSNLKTRAFLQEREHLNQELENFTSFLLDQTKARPDIVGPLLKEMRKDLDAFPELKECIQRVFPQFLQHSLQPHTLLRGLKNKFLVESSPSLNHPFLSPLNNAIEKIRSFEQEALFQNEGWLTRFKGLREHYESYARSLCELSPEDRIHFLSGIPLRTERLDQTYFISKETAYELLSMDAHGLITRANGTGSSAVASFKGVHFKRNLLRKHLNQSKEPEGTLNPGMEWAMYAFYKLLGEGGIPPSSLIILEDVPQKEALPDTRAATLVEQASDFNLSALQRKDIIEELSFDKDRKKEFRKASRSYVLQASHTIEGPLLGNVLKDIRKNQSSLSGLDPKKTSSLFIASLLTNPADAKEDNFIVRKTVEDLQEIVSIDNDLSLASLIVQEQDTHLLEAKNILYCLPEVREQPLHKDIRKRIRDLPIQAFLLEWLSLLQQQDKRYQRLLNEGVLTPEEYKTLYFPLRLTTNTLQEMEAKLIHLQGIIRKSSTITHQELLEQMFPLVGLYYKTVLSQGKDSLSTFQRIYSFATSPSIEEVCPLDYYLPDGHQVKERLAQETTFRGAYRDRTQTLDIILEQFLRALDLTSYTPQQKINLLETTIRLFPEEALRTPHESWRNKYLIHELISHKPSLQLIEFLLREAPESLKAQDSIDQQTLLHHIVISHPDNHPEILDLILSKGALLELKDKRGLTPLDYAMNKQKETFFARLIQKGASQANVDVALKFYRTLSLTSESYKAFDALITHNPEVAWHIALEHILPSSGIGIEVQGATIGKRVLPTHLENQLFDDQGNFIRQNMTGRHDVGYIEDSFQERVYRLYFKLLPELPGLEEAVGLLTRQIMGWGAPFSELIYLQGKPVLVSYGIQGPTLTEIFKRPSNESSNPPELSQLDPASLSAMILMAMLTNPEDGKPDNLILEQLPLSLINTAAPPSYRIVSIDNDHAFVPAVAKEQKSSFFRPEPLVQVKTLLFSLDQMNDKVHPQVRERIINLDVGETLEQWIRELRKRHSLYRELFRDQKEILRYLEKENCYIGVPFRKGAIEELYQKIVRLQEDLTSHPSITHFEFLKKLEPALAHRYQQGFLKPMTVAQRFDLVDGPFYRQDQQGHRQTITQSGDILRSMDIPLKEDLIETIRKGGLHQANYQPEMALTALKQIRKQHGALALMKQQASIDIILKNLGELNLSDHRMSLLENIDFKSLSQPQQRAVFELLKGQEFRKLYLKQAIALTDPYLMGLIPLSKVVSINLEGCTQLTQAAIVYIADQASLLEYLNVSGIDNLQGISRSRRFGRSEALKFLTLKKLYLNGCNRMESLLIEAPLLEIIEAQKCPRLQKMALTAPILQVAYFRENILLPLADMVAFIKANLQLREIYLEGCPNIPLKPKLPFDEVKFNQALEDYKKNYKKATLKNNASAQYEIGTLYGSGEGVEKDYGEAMKWFLKAASQDNADAQYIVGAFYDSGHGVEKDYAEAMKWYLKAASQRDAYAQDSIGVLYKNGEGVEKDYGEAMKWFLKAANQGHAYAQNNIGSLYRNGDGVEKNYKEAMKWYRKAADQGNAGAQNNIGSLYRNGDGVEKDYKEAMKWYLKSASQGNASAQYNIGFLYRNGYGVEQNYKEAMKRYRKAANQGNASAQNGIGILYQYGYGVEKDYKEAMKWYLKAANQGNAVAQVNIGSMYLVGQGTERNSKIAIEWFTKAAQQENKDGYSWLGSVYCGCLSFDDLELDYQEGLKWFKQGAEKGDENSLYWLGFMYSRGLGVKCDKGEAQRWFQKSFIKHEENAQNGKKSSKYDLGCAYLYGQGTDKNIEKAFQLFQEAVQENDALAQNRLGRMYKEGLGVKKDDKAAFEWIQKSAHQDEPRGQYNLGLLYRDGEGVKRDDTEAVKWFKKAFRQGNADACYSLGWMYEKGRGVEKNEEEAMRWYKRGEKSHAEDVLYSIGRIYEYGLAGEAQSLIEALKWYKRAADLHYEPAIEKVEALESNGKRASFNEPSR